MTTAIAMSPPQPILVWDTLREFGFSSGSEERVSADTAGLSIDFGDFTLHAISAANKWFAEVVHFSGTLTTTRVMVDISFELPQRVESRRHLAAFLTYYLDKAFDGVFHPKRDYAWLAVGRKHRDVLPWELAIASYRNRLRCVVQRDWLRLALGNLKQLLAQCNAGSDVMVGFDGSVLSIGCQEKILPMPADGQPWGRRDTIPARNLQHLPKRLPESQIEVSVYDGRLHIGRVCFDVLEEKVL